MPDNELPFSLTGVHISDHEKAYHFLEAALVAPDADRPDGWPACEMQDLAKLYADTQPGLSVELAKLSQWPTQLSTDDIRDIWETQPRIERLPATEAWIVSLLCAGPQAPIMKRSPETHFSMAAMFVASAGVPGTAAYFFRYRDSDYSDNEISNALFRGYVLGGHLHLAKSLVKTPRTFDLDWCDICFACEHGTLPTIKWLIEDMGVIFNDDDEADEIYDMAFSRCKADAALWLLQRQRRLNREEAELFWCNANSAIGNDNGAVLQVLFDHAPAENNVMTIHNLEIAYSLACSINALVCAKFLAFKIGTHPETESTVDDYGMHSMLSYHVMMEAVKGNSLNVVCWLHECNPGLIQDHYPEFFSDALRRNAFAVAYWMSMQTFMRGRRFDHIGFFKIQANSLNKHGLRWLIKRYAIRSLNGHETFVAKSFMDNWGFDKETFKWLLHQDIMRAMDVWQVIENACLLNNTRALAILIQLPTFDLPGNSTRLVKLIRSISGRAAMLTWLLKQPGLIDVDNNNTV